MLNSFFQQEDSKHSQSSIKILQLGFRSKNIYKNTVLLLLVLDMAVGCPYGGEDQQGLVFIYNGHAGGLNHAASQTLSGQWAVSAFPSGFGFAMRGDKDLDQNGYPGTGENIFPPDMCL